jgi:hypothetical protein
MPMPCHASSGASTFETTKTIRVSAFLRAGFGQVSPA